MDVLILWKCFLIDNLIIIVYVLKRIGYYFDWIIIHYNLTTPIALILVALLVTKKNSDKQLAINQQNNQEEILEKYLESIGELLLNDDDQDNRAMNIARFKTLTVLRRLTFKPERDKAIILKFLYDTELIKIQDYNCKTSKLELAFCDFQKANLIAANLEGANLNRVDFEGASLVAANLIAANFEGGSLKGANLLAANLNRANLKRVILEGTNLEEAYLYQTNELNIKELKSAKNWEKAVYTKGELNYDNYEWVPVDKEENEAKIQEIRDSTEGIVQF
ncbi:MAG: pentapeptide repeat-containing protein [Crocosphaera sp.]